MASELEEMLQPGERLVYRAGYSWLTSIAQTVALAAFILAVGAGFLLVTGDQVDPFKFLAAYVVFFPVVLRAHRSQIVLLTERRLLFQCGYWRRKTEAVSIDDIIGIEYRVSAQAPRGAVLVNRRNGGKLRIVGVPKRGELGFAIASETGLPLLGDDPGVTKFDTILGVSGIILGLVFFASIYRLTDSTVTAQLNSPDATVGLFLGLFAAGVLLFFMCIIIGSLLSYALGLFVLRFTMDAEQMRQLVCSGYVATDKTPSVRITRGCSNLAARYVSWLYGEEIRCE